MSPADGLCLQTSFQIKCSWPCSALSAAFVWLRGAGSVINAVHQNLIAQPQLHRKQLKEPGMTELLCENYSAVS